MIFEFEDFARWVSIEEWKYIEEQLKDGETDILDKTTGDHKEFEFLWFLIGTFREKHGLPRLIYDPEGNEIIEQEYYEIMDELFKKYGVER